MKKIGLISDTHSYLDAHVATVFKDCDEIWHAGDIGNASVTDGLAQLKPLRAVYGNIDDATQRITYPEFQHFTLEGVRVLLIHIAGSFGKYTPQVRDILLSHGPVDLLVCGHSHLLKVQMDQKYNCLYMNPGAAGIHGFHKMRTCLRFVLDNGRITNLELVELGLRGKIDSTSKENR